MMVKLRRLKARDVPQLYEMALRAFAPDYERYGVYPPLLKTEKKKFLPPRLFGKAIVSGGTIVGAAFVVGLIRRGELGAIFIDPAQQGKGYGRLAMLEIEKRYPNVGTWTLETPAESHHLHRFYESLGYRKIDEKKDAQSGMTGVVYQKKVR